MQSGRVLLFALVGLVGVVVSIPIDNGVINFPNPQTNPNPIVTCGNEGFDLLVYVQNNDFFRNPQPQGRVFIKGQAGRTPANCVSFQAEPRPEQSMLLIRLNYAACPTGVSQRREASGLTRSVTLVLSFHPFFLTKVDRAFEISCEYRQPMKEVTAPLGVSMIPVTPLDQRTTMPSCIYQILDKATERPIRYAQIGDKVLHRWKCSGPAEQWCMTVHSCGLQTEPTPRFTNGQGCTKDPFILGNAVYEPGALEAEVEAHVFKLPDVADLDFRCSIRLMPRRVGSPCPRASCDSGAAPLPLPRPRPQTRRPRAKRSPQRSMEGSEQEVDGHLSVLELEALSQDEERQLHTLLRRANDFAQSRRQSKVWAEPESCVSGVYVSTALVGSLVFGLFSLSILILTLSLYGRKWKA